MERHEEHDELSDAPLLRSLAKQDPFVTPSGFFEVFPQTVQQRVHAERSARRGWALWPRFAVGSLTALVLAALVWSAWPTEPGDSDLVHAEPEELLDDGVDEELLFSALYEEDALMDPVALPEDDAEVLAYLENEDLPLDELIEDL